MTDKMELLIETTIQFLNKTAITLGEIAESIQIINGTLEKNLKEVYAEKDKILDKMEVEHEARKSKA